MDWCSDGGTGRCLHPQDASHWTNTDFWALRSRSVMFRDHRAKQNHVDCDADVQSLFLHRYKYHHNNSTSSHSRLLWKLICSANTLHFDFLQLPTSDCISKHVCFSQLDGMCQEIWLMPLYHTAMWRLAIKIIHSCLFTFQDEFS